MIKQSQKPIALILAGGASSRLEPYAYLNQHKSMLSLLGRPIMEHVILELKKSGLEEIVIVLNPANNDVRSHFGDGKKFGVTITYANQPNAQGMGHAVLCAKHLLTRPFLIFNPNHINAADFVSPLIEAFTGQFKAVLLGRVTDEPWRYGIFDIKRDQIVDIVEKPKKGKEPSNKRVVGIYLVDPIFIKTLEATPPEEYSLEKALATFAKKEKVRLLLTERMTYSLKFPWDLFTLTNALFERQKSFISPKAKVSKTAIIEGKVIIDEGACVYDYAVIKGPAYIGRGAVVGTHAIVRGGSVLEQESSVGAYSEIARSIFMEKATIHSGYVDDAIIGRSTVIGAGFITANRRLDRGEISVNVKGEKVNTKQTSFGMLMGHDVKVGIHAGTMPGTVIHSGSIIGPGTMVFKDVVPPNSSLKTRFQYNE